MQTNLASEFQGTAQGEEAERILRKCVHCGFCTATCPTYQLLGDELDGPRGRIYLIKQALEGAPVTAKTQLHLDRCLSCRSCETTCPSGVQYGRLLDIGRKIVDERVDRALPDRLTRAGLAQVVSRPGVFGPLMKLGQSVRAVLPGALRSKVPAAPRPAGAWPAPRHARRMIALAGCAQSSMAPDINAAAARLLDRIGISLLEVPGAGCCGALRFHVGYQDDGRNDMRALIDAWWPRIERGEIETLVMTASGCGAVVREYGHLLGDDQRYAEKAARVAGMTRDLTEVLHAELSNLRTRVEQLQGEQRARERIAFHAPCTLQHGQQIRGVAEEVLQACGFDLTPVADAHLCCGSAGTYSVLQPQLANQLRANKLAALQAGGPGVIATANIGCLTHLQAGTPLPVLHWIVALERRLAR